MDYEDIIDSAKYSEGDRVLYRGGFGRGSSETVTVEGVDEKNVEVVMILTTDTGATSHK